MRRLRRRYGHTHEGYASLASIRTLYRAPHTLALYGIPYRMRHEVGQSPRHIAHGGRPGHEPPRYPADWIWLGTPGWYGSMSSARRAEVEHFLARHKEHIPGNPYEWGELP